MTAAPKPTSPALLRSPVVGKALVVADVLGKLRRDVVAVATGAAVVATGVVVTLDLVVTAPGCAVVEVFVDFGVSVLVSARFGRVGLVGTALRAINGSCVKVGAVGATGAVTAR